MSELRVAIDARWLFFNRSGTGINRRTLRLAHHLPQVDPDVRVDMVYNFVRSRHRKAIEGFGAPGVRPRVIRIPRVQLEWLLVQRRLPAEMLLGPFDVWHGEFFFAPATIRAKSLVLVHDLYSVHVPESLPNNLCRYLQRHLKRVCAGASGIATGTAAVADELVDHLGVDRDRIHILYPGFDPPRPMEEHESAVLDRLGLESGGYIFFLGTLVRWKNLDGILDAFEMIRRDARRPLKLVLAGPRMDNGDVEMEKRLEEAAKSPDIVFPGFVAEEDLDTLYRSALCFLFPSHYEGFGIPVLEAMAREVPVVASKAPALLEVTGGAALHADSRDPAEIASAVLRLADDEKLRGELVEKGKERVRAFSWSKMARDALDIYSRLEPRRRWRRGA
ncbi:MAG: hypothetical protein CME06_08280 [Gemmatimonadetes bacterium]|nr:hypothetical protein [Gemmatimonadota bacterium]